MQTDKTHNPQIDWHTDENLQNGRVSSHNSQIIRLSIDRLLNRKSQAHILEAIEFRLCVQRDIKIPDHVYPTGAYLSGKNQYEINMFNCVISAIKCYFRLHRVPIFLSVLGLLKTSRKYITYTNEQTQKLVISNVFKAFLTQLVTFSKWQHRVYTKIFVTWDALSFLGNLEELYGWLLVTPWYIFTINFSGSHYRLGNHTQLKSKHCEHVMKAKIGILIFLNSFFYNHIKLTVMKAFPQGSIYFFVLFYYFEMKRIVLYDFDNGFYHFCPYSYRYDVKVDEMFICCI